VLQVGNLRGPLAAVESRTHFGAWCIVSSPLVLGMDLTNETTMGAVWPYVSNAEAVQVNQRWAGDPGRLLNLSSSTADPAAAVAKAKAKAKAAPAVEVWAKLQPSGAVALLAINTDATASSAETSVDLAAAWPQGAMPAGWCRSKPCAIRDIWKQESGGQTGADHLWHVGALAPHDSAFVLVSPS
jgi:alpha-galactosidase